MCGRLDGVFVDRLFVRLRHQTQAHPASFHLISLSLAEVKAASLLAEAEGRALELPPTKSRVTEVRV